jgi:hypothetical protein
MNPKPPPKPPIALPPLRCRDHGETLPCSGCARADAMLGWLLAGLCSLAIAIPLIATFLTRHR